MKTSFSKVVPKISSKCVLCYKHILLIYLNHQTHKDKFFRTLTPITPPAVGLLGYHTIQVEKIHYMFFLQCKHRHFKNQKNVSNSSCKHMRFNARVMSSVLCIHNACSCF
jgi:hypothetical protein